MAAARAMQQRHLPNGSIQLLLVKPGMCTIGQCSPHCTATSACQSKWPAFCLHFLLLSIWLLATAIDRDHVMVGINSNRVNTLFLLFLYIYSHIMGTHQRWWMPFRPPFLMAGEQLIEYTCSHRIKLIKQSFINLYKTKPNRSCPAPPKEVLSVRLGRFIYPRRRRGKWCHHGGDVCEMVVLVVDGTFCTIPTMGKLWSKSVLFLQSPK